MCTVCIQGPQKPEESTESLGTGAKDSSESPSVTCELRSSTSAIKLLSHLSSSLFWVLFLLGEVPQSV